MLIELKNPITETYLFLKNQVLSSHFPWFWFESSTGGRIHEGHTDVPYYGHCVIERPSFSKESPLYLYPKVTSDKYIDVTNEVVKEIALFNNLDINSVFRINFNCVHHVDGNPTIPHTDHDFPHKNLLIYFNNSAGNTIVYGEKKNYSFEPKEDAVIMFEGLHCGGQPLKGQRRVVLVVTYC